MEELKTVVGGGRLIAESASTCGDTLQRSDWASTHAVRLDDDLLVGVRLNDDAVGELLTRVFADRIVADDTTAAHYSLVRQAGSPDSYQLYGGSTMLIDRTSQGRAVRGLVRYLDSYRLAGAPGRLRLAVTAVVGPGGAGLGPATVRGQLLQIEGRLNDRDQVLLDAPWVYVDPDSAELVWEPIGLDVDLSVLEAAPGASSADGQEAQPGRYPIGCLWFAVSAEGDGPLRPSQAVLESASLLVNPADLGASASLAALQALTQRIDVTAVSFMKVEDLLEQFPAVAKP